MSVIQNIPKQYNEGFRKLITLEDESFHLLFDALVRAPVVNHPKTLAKRIAQESKIATESVESILMCASSLIQVREQTESSTAEIVDDICRVISKGGVDDVRFSTKEGEERFRSRFEKLLNNEQLLLCSKSLDLLTEYEKVFISGRIATDVRPVFGLNIEGQPKGALIIHTLHIHYHEGEDKHQDAYLAMDSDDLKSLDRVIARAMKKEESLRSVLDKSGLPNLSPRENK